MNDGSDDSGTGRWGTPGFRPSSSSAEGPVMLSDSSSRSPISRDTSCPCRRLRRRMTPHRSRHLRTWSRRPKRSQGRIGSRPVPGRRIRDPATALMLDAIARRRLSATGLLDAACAAERLASWTQAVQHRYLAAFARPGVCASTAEPDRIRVRTRSTPASEVQPIRRAPGPDHLTARLIPERRRSLSCSGVEVHGDPAISDALGLAAFKVAAAEVAAALRVSPISANRRVSQAVDFADGLPVTLTALQRGVIDRGRSLVIADRTQNLPPDLRRRVEDVVVPKATTRNAGQLRGIVDRAVIAADPAAAKKRQEAARRNRGVSLRAGEDGMSVFRADLPADKACTAFTVIDQIALINSRRAAERSHDQRAPSRRVRRHLRPTRRPRFRAPAHHSGQGALQR